MRNILIASLFFAGLALSGCADGAKAEYDEISQSKAGQTAKTAWNAFNFATNIANPMYYAGKVASTGYDKYKEKKQEGSGSE